MSINPVWYQRLRHAKGFGIHSPFAYRFITEVLNQRLPYYRYSEIDLMATGRLRPRDLRLVFRLATFFRTSNIRVTGATDDEVRALRAAAAATGAAGDGDILAIHLDSKYTETRDNAVCRLCLCRAEALDAMTFRARRYSVGVYLPHLPRQLFHVRF